MRRTLSPFKTTLLLLLILPGAARARFHLAPGFPWSYSVTGSETATALGVDRRERVWVAGNVTHPASGRDILVQVYSITKTGEPITSTPYAYSDGDESEPSLAMNIYNNAAEALLAFTSSFTGQTEMVVFVSRLTTGAWTGGGALALTGMPGGRVNGIRLDGSGTPYVAASLIYPDTEPMLYLRWPRSYASAESLANELVTYAHPSESSTKAFVDGRGVDADGAGNSWMVAEEAGDVLLFEFDTEAYPYTSPLSGLRGRVAWSVRHATTADDNPRALRRDSDGNLWVAGAADGRWAIWKFDPAGGAIKGFPVVDPGGLGSSATLYELIVDRKGRCFAVGTSDSEMLFAGVDRSGGLLSGFPITVSVTELADSGLPARLAGRGLGFAQDGSIWIAATASYKTGAAAAAGWGSYTKLFLYGEEATPPAVPSGAVVVSAVASRGGRVARGGQVINLERNETLEIIVHPRQSGRLRARIMTMRGELIDESWETVGGGQETVFTWDGRTAAGTRVASGAYAILVTGAGVNEVRRAVVIRKR